MVQFEHPKGDDDRRKDIAIRRLQRFIEIKQRGETRAAYGRNRYPSHINKPKNKIERQEYSDYRWLDRWKKRVVELTQTERVLYNEIMSWKAEKRNQLTRLQRLTEIKCAGLKRFAIGGRKYPRNHRKPLSNRERIEHNDYRWLSRLKDRAHQLTREERVIFDQLMSWKPPTKRIQSRRERLIEIRNRGVTRGHNHMQMYPRNVNKPLGKEEKKEYNDYYWLAQLKHKLQKLSTEELKIYREIQVWKTKRRSRFCDRTYSPVKRQRIEEPFKTEFDSGQFYFPTHHFQKIEEPFKTDFFPSTHFSSPFLTNDTISSGSLYMSPPKQEDVCSPLEYDLNPFTYTAPITRSHGLAKLEYDLNPFTYTAYTAPISHQEDFQCRGLESRDPYGFTTLAASEARYSVAPEINYSPFHIQPRYSLDPMPVYTRPYIPTYTRAENYYPRDLEYHPSIPSNPEPVALDPDFMFIKTEDV